MGGYRFSFTFYHVMDLKKVLEGGPWSFEQNMLVYKQVQEDDDPHAVALTESDIWVQIHDIPRGFISETILKSVGGFIGKYIKSDLTNFDGAWKAYVRIRVILDITKPLKRRMKIKRDGGEWSWLNFKYERLGNFCFVCGILGHTDRECSTVYANPDKEIERAYGVWLRAQNRSMKHNAGARWLRNTEGGSKGEETSGGTRRRTAVGEDENVLARFTEVSGTVREVRGENHVVLIRPRNQEGEDMGITDSNLGGSNEKASVILEAKRKRSELE